ncbi:HOPM interactor 7 isoform 1 [Hibiscus syriacus]|uniref:HOPM interactor 7 isoform 1 n=1 Tax=Hibiscus syriacus TaxID=106335 RepID=A0A6A2Z757_HIBSY|nr:E3 ubiquitin-protein ligase ATL4-like [Hibiscus syriacus]KAE8687831.1 HOPM interactor 7 isoform 1 [Hibiscus syriacus]
MCFFLDDSGLIVSHLLYKTAVVLAVLRWVLVWALNLRFNHVDGSSSAQFSLDSQHDSSSSPEMIRDNLVLTTFGDAKQRMPWVSDTCAVCLCELKEGDDVRELRNCCHVFHQDCIDRWVEYDEDEDEDDDNHKSCPLCRAPLLTSSLSLVGANNEPSWAVDRMLYLFGDDLLP